LNEVTRHPTALVASTNIGSGTRIWAFVNICADAKIGMDCNICDHVFIENQVVIGNRVTIKCGVFIWDKVTLEDDVFVGPGVAFTNDLHPRSKQYPKEYLPTLVKSGASIGANSTILAGVTIGVNAMVGAGSVVTKDVPPNAIVRGNPARVEGYVQTKGTPRIESIPGGADRVETVASSVLNVSNVRLIEMPKFADLRGVLSIGEIESELPFLPKRYFLVYEVPSKVVRGQHAHRELEELLICVHGSCHVVVDDGQNIGEVVLDSPQLALYIPPMVWTIQYKYSPGTVLMVLASEKYEVSDYILDYDEFLKLRSGEAML
jgi:UDP-2-acetamido-3-amino-2,3-dideoxy-glucuronate N-acetyltransferase